MAHHRACGDESELSDPNKLMHTSEPSDGHSVSKLNVTCEARSIREGAVVTNACVVPDMALGHKEVLCSDLREPNIEGAPQRDRTPLAEAVPGTTAKPRRSVSGALFFSLSELRL